MDPLVKWLVAGLARFELPDSATAPADLQVLLKSYFASDLQGASLTQRLADALRQQTSGRVSAFVIDTPQNAAVPRGPAAWISVTGQRHASLTPSETPVEWLD